MIPSLRQGLRRDGQNKNGGINPKIGIHYLRGDFGLQYSSTFVGLPLEAEGGSFSPRLSIANAIVGPALQMQRRCPANLQSIPVYS